VQLEVAWQLENVEYSPEVCLRVHESGLHDPSWTLDQRLTRAGSEGSQYVDHHYGGHLESVGLEADGEPSVKVPTGSCLVCEAHEVRMEGGWCLARLEYPNRRRCRFAQGSANDLDECLAHLLAFPKQALMVQMMNGRLIDRFDPKLCGRGDQRLAPVAGHAQLETRAQENTARGVLQNSDHPCLYCEAQRGRLGEPCGLSWIQGALKVNAHRLLNLGGHGSDQVRLA
jgi:hypothetical protein